MKAVSDSLDSSELKLKGVMRVGPLAKGLLLQSDDRVQLVLLASDVPTNSFLDSVVNKLQSYLSSKSESDTFVVSSCPGQALMEIKASICVQVGLTSPAVRASNSEMTDQDDALPKEKCLKHLADIRHAKW